MSDTRRAMEEAEWGRQHDDGEVLLSPAWEVFILGVSLLSLFNLAVILPLRSAPLEQVFIIMDALMTGIFLIDVVRRTVVATNRRRYFVQGYGWLDLLASFPVLRILRIFRVVRVVRVLGRFGGPLQAFKAFFSNRAAGGLLTVLLVAILVLEFGSLAMLAVESAARDANITTAGDAVWYTLVTMSTVGYGDTYPTTDLGRLIGAFIIVVGVGVFGTLTGFLANVFLAPSEASPGAPGGVADQPPREEPEEAAG